MVHTQKDILARLKATLPVRWFGESTPVLDSVLGALATGWTGLLRALDYASLQARINTASDDWLDLIAKDFFEYRIGRRQLETDGSFRNRIFQELARDRCTRRAISGLVADLTGKSPAIFEPANPMDTGCYGSSDPSFAASAGYCVAGGWGNLGMPFQAFLNVSRPVRNGISFLNGWGGTIGGFDVGQSAYTSLTTDLSEASDLEIYRSIARVSPAGMIIWVSLS
jgi:hypothetical protein